MGRALLVAAAVLALAAPARAGGPALVVGAAEDAGKEPTLVGATAKFELARLAGFRAIRLTALWAPGLAEPPAEERLALANAAAAANLAGVRLVVSVYPFGSSVTPLTPEARAEFAAFAAAVARLGFAELIVGNEPNINRFWLPQFGEDGTSRSAADFLPLLAETYDAVKAAAPRALVWGIGLSPRGGDNPLLARHTHSPTRFIRDLGAAYRASGRAAPVMDGLAIHPYGDTSSQAPRDSAHPRSTTIGLADYDKLVALLGEAFDGTAQRGSTLPILYDEYGVESLIPPAKAALYTGAEPATTRPVDEATQAAYYREAIGLAFCQPNVRGLLLFHVTDETALGAWQSGLYYADDTPKPGLPAVRTAIAESRRGVVARCDGLALVPRATVRRVAAARGLAFHLACDLDCAYRLRLLRHPGGAVVRTLAGTAVGGTTRRLALAAPRPTGLFRVEARVTATVNPGPARTVRGAAFRVTSR